MLVRIPSLEPFLDEAQNRGWFEIVDPDGGKQSRRGVRESAAIRAEAHPDVLRPASRSLGRSRGAELRRGRRVAHPRSGRQCRTRHVGRSLERHELFQRRTLYVSGWISARRPVAHRRWQPLACHSTHRFHRRAKAARGEKTKDAEPGDKPAPGPAEPAYWEVGLGLTWSVALGAFGTGSIVSFEPEFDKKDQPTSKLEIAVKATRKLGQGSEPTPEKGDAPAKKPSRGVSLTASAKVTKFALVLNVSETDKFSIGFEEHQRQARPAEAAKERDGEGNAG